MNCTRQNWKYASKITIAACFIVFECFLNIFPQEKCNVGPSGSMIFDAKGECSDDKGADAIAGYKSNDDRMSYVCEYHYDDFLTYMNTQLAKQFGYKKVELGDKFQGAYELSGKKIVIIAPTPQHRLQFKGSGIELYGFGNKLEEIENQNGAIVGVKRGSGEPVDLKFEINSQDKKKDLLMVFGSHCDFKKLFMNEFIVEEIKKFVKKFSNKGIKFKYIIVEGCDTGFTMSLFKPILSKNGFAFGTLCSGSADLVCYIREHLNGGNISDLISQALNYRAKNTSETFFESIYRTSQENSSLQRLKEGLEAFLGQKIPQQMETFFDSQNANKEWNSFDEANRKYAKTNLFEHKLIDTILMYSQRENKYYYPEWLNTEIANLYYPLIGSEPIAEDFREIKKCYEEEYGQTEVDKFFPVESIQTVFDSIRRPKPNPKPSW